MLLSLVENVEDYAIIVLDLNGLVIRWNTGAEMITGYGAEDVLGTHFYRLFTPTDLEAGVPQQELMTAEKVGRAADERWHVRKDGSRFWALGLVVPVRNADGNLVAFGKFLRDRTDLKQLQEILQQQNTSLKAIDAGKNHFLATLAHELRNPLGAMANSVHLLKRHGQGDELVRGEIARLERQLRQAMGLIEDLADLSRSSRENIRLLRKSIDLRRSAAQAVDTVRGMMEERGHQLDLLLPETPVMIAGDETRLQQIIGNLLSNAARYTPRGGRVSLSLTAEGSEAVMRISDNGIGIPPHQLASIFDLFTQAHADYSESQAGLGIGLTLARELITLHGGTIQALSEGVGKGSEFTARFPLESQGGPQRRSVG
ncbi:MAG TPA: PAS domain-containing sensor histidine kinase [Steroidobacteraceae bacterium]|nr:PAS domain-containing sensor histidine kinase [Steroidobacteraceae bacterium]